MDNSELYAVEDDGLERLHRFHGSVVALADYGHQIDAEILYHGRSDILQEHVLAMKLVVEHSHEANLAEHILLQGGRAKVPYCYLILNARQILIEQCTDSVGVILCIEIDGFYFLQGKFALILQFVTDLLDFTLDVVQLLVDLQGLCGLSLQPLLLDVSQRRGNGDTRRPDCHSVAIQCDAQHDGALALLVHEVSTHVENSLECSSHTTSNFK